ncbi:uncharacterized protein LOC124936486 [Impatiens glandulifera]|uniref:uncharacterized protein LOC124936486 n=1 Tax=Impatiens glandulifera TaxID=253017 RepID=UPI001FB19FFD|nr:uncharacterized protein LOC124936486 [Impatiens glandulifera]
MASAFRLFQRSTVSVGTFLSRDQGLQSATSIGSRLSKLRGSVPNNLSSSISHTPKNRLFSSRLPVELCCYDSLMPLHSATASSLLISKLSSEVGQWGCLSEGFATPL